MNSYGEFRLENEQQHLEYRQDLLEDMHYILTGIQAMGHFALPNLKRENPDREIKRFLQQLGEDLHADRTYIFETKPDGTFSNTYEWCAEGVAAHQAQLQDLAESVYGPEWFLAFRRGNGYIVADLEAYGKFDPAMYEMLQKQNIHSLAVFPLQIQGRYVGFFGLDNLPRQYLELAAALFILAAKMLSFMLLQRNYISSVEAAKQVDPLTGLRSVSSFTTALDQLAERVVSGDEKEPWDVVYFNVADFKVFNMQHSMGEGDALLQDMGHTLRELVGTDQVTRYMGDHFYALLPHARAVAVVEALHEKMKNWPGYQVDIHAGIYTLTQTDWRPGVALDRAKMAGDSARNDFTNYYRIYDAEMETRLTQHDYLTTHLDEAIEQGWVQPYYQPVVQTATGKISHLEALARLIDPEGGMVLNPADFLPMLEANHMLYKVDLAILQAVCRSLSQQRSTGQPYLPASINVSALDFEIEDIHERINRIVDAAGVPRQLLSFEITESTMGREQSGIGDHLQRFHQDGYQVWLDNFGSGYNSLHGLQSFDFDLVKIDMLFLRHHSDKSLDIINNIVDMAQALGMQTLAEGVDNSEQYNFLSSIGCNYIQGYYISKPLPGELSRSLLQEMAAQNGLLQPEV